LVHFQMRKSLRQRLKPATYLERHRHTRACVAIVLDGRYHEAGDNGRWHTQPGDVLVYQPFTSHLNYIPTASTILNLPLAREVLRLRPRYRIDDVDRLVITAERDSYEATGMLLEQLLPGRAAFDEPVDHLAHQLAVLDAPGVQVLAQKLNVCRETVFRRFRSVYGVSPTRYRTEARTRCAWLEIVTSSTPLATVAADFGFADQAHLSRSVRALTGATPCQWRATFVQDGDHDGC
jgi:AraC-like DNA-binding protein